MIDFSDLEDAFLFVGSDQPFMNSAIVNKRTGETFYQSELSGIDDFRRILRAIILLRYPIRMT